MERLLLTIAICGFPALVFAKEQGDVSDNSGQFMRTDEIIVVFTEHGKTVSQMKTNVVGILPNGDLKIYGEKFTGIGQNTWKYTLSGIVRVVDIAEDDTAHPKDIRDLLITNRKLKKTKERIRRRCRHKRYSNIIPTIKKDPILQCKRSTGHHKRSQRQRLHYHLRQRRPNQSNRRCFGKSNDFELRQCRTTDRRQGCRK